MTSTSPRSQPRIAIIGGGPGGIVLLHTLHHHGVSATLYKREMSMSSRAHLGGSLDLGWNSGQHALRENGLQGGFEKYSRPEGEELKICDAVGNIVIQTAQEDVKDPLDACPEIDRKDLRKILMESVPAKSIKWGYALSSARALKDGQHKLTFVNGLKTTCDILVGADGAHSRVRPLLSPATAVYARITGAELMLLPTVAASPELKDFSDFVGKGTVFAAQNNKVLRGQRNSDGRIRVYSMMHAPADWSLPTDPDAAKHVLLDLYEGWSPLLRKSIALSDDAVIYPRPMYHLPVGHRWDHVDGVTLTGDAAHLSTPFAGAGANLAMLDGLELGLALADAILSGRGREEREVAVAVWEEKTFESSRKIAAITMENLDAFFNPNAPEMIVQRMKAFLEQPWARREA